METRRIVLFDKIFLKQFSEKHNFDLTENPISGALSIRIKNIVAFFDNRLDIVYFGICNYREMIPVANVYFINSPNEKPYIEVKYHDRIGQGEKVKIEATLKQLTEDIDLFNQGKIVAL